MRKDLLPIISMACFFVIVQLIALTLAGTFEERGMQTLEDPEDIENSFYLLGMILVFTLVILILSQFKLKRLIQVMILFAIFTTLFYVLYPLLWVLWHALFHGVLASLPFFIALAMAFVLAYLLVKWREWYVIAGICVIISFVLWNALLYGSLIALLLFIPLAIAFMLTVLLLKRPEWYVVDTVGLIVAPGIATIFGISLAILPALVFLIALAVYDAIAVYKTKHMIDLADNVVELRLPILLVVPKKRSYSFLKQKKLKDELQEGTEREALFMGLGDAIIPAILAVSALTFLRSLPVALATLVGSLVGFVLLMWLVARGKPQAGLPLLNSGAILGYLLSYYITFGELTFGVM